MRTQYEGCQKEGRRELLILWSKPELTFKLGLWHHFFLAEEVTTRGRREVRGSMAGDKGRTTPLRGARF